MLQNPVVTVTTSGKKTSSKSVNYHLAIELPYTEYGNKLKEFKKNTREFLSKIIKDEYKLHKSDESKDIKKSIVYLIRCNKPQCKRNIYIGRTQIRERKNVLISMLQLRLQRYISTLMMKM